MKQEIQEKLTKLIENNVAVGFVRGQSLFVESLNEDLEKTSVLNNVQLEGVMQYLLADHIENN